MSWLQLHIATDPDHADAFQDALEALGAGAVTLTDGADQPVFEPPPGARPLWRTTVVTALFSDDTDTDAILARLGDQGLVFADHRVEALADQVWERAWMADFQPMRFGERLWIVPSWSDAPEPDAVNLKLDPGLAFGTGTHDTTALCLEWLEQTDLDGKRILDFGCGSGVLAIAALLLGAERVVCVDIDPQALTATRQNAETNGVADRIATCLPEAFVAAPADFVLANILAGPLKTLAPTLAGQLKPGGRLVLAGLLDRQAEELHTCYAPYLRFEPDLSQEGWTRIAGQRLQDQA